MASFAPVLAQPDWNNLAVVQRNALPPRAAFYNYASPHDALAGEYATAAAVCLSGTWQFRLYESPWVVPGNAHEAVDSAYRQIDVPGMWQLQEAGAGGVGPRYTNMALPFPVDPPNVPLTENETGHYVRTFAVPQQWTAGHQLRLRFEGVDAAFHVFVNGRPIGYSEGSRNPAEFDVTEAVNNDTTNVLSVLVYKWCNGTYFEDQDQWWLSGIFRDVHLLAFPLEKRIEDFKVETHLDEAYTDATLVVKVRLNAPGTVKLQLLDTAGDGDRVLFDGEQSGSQVVRVDPLTDPEAYADGRGGVHVTFSVPVRAPRLWTAETPYLYKAVLSTHDGKQVICQPVGFRQVEMSKDGALLLVNGKRIVLRGANRHEHHPSKGRAVPFDFMRTDLLRMKQHNINAIRTAHYPNDHRLYELANTLGFYVLDEADLETHGFSQVELAALTDAERALSKKGVISLECGRATAWITNRPEYQHVYIDRQRQMVARDKNWACVVMWSLGNESYHGANTVAAHDWVRRADPTRPVHYEGDRDAEVVDVYSLMYPSIPEVMDLLANAPQSKPILLCEYLYGIGNGAGAIGHYIDLFYEHPRLQGGFVWQWASQGLLTKTADGTPFYGYGGDFGDVINDGRENTHGYNFSDHVTPKPALAELKHALQPVRVVSATAETVVLQNRHDFATLDSLQCTWSLVRNGAVSNENEVAIPANCLPGQTVELPIDITEQLAALSQTSTSTAIRSAFPSPVYINVTLTLKEATNWAPQGHIVAADQFRLDVAPVPVSVPSVPSTVSSPTAPPVNKLSLHLVEIGTASASLWTFDLLKGQLLAWTKNGQSLLAAAPALGFYRPQTDHDMAGAGKLWTAKMLQHVKSHTLEVVATAGPSSVDITVKARAGPPGLEWGFRTTTTYAFSSDTLAVRVQGEPFGVNAPPTLARIGLDLTLDPALDHTAWFGRGPGEAYRDRKHAQRVGNWDASLDTIWTPFEFPQESGNRTDVQCVAFYDQHNKGGARQLSADFGARDGCSFNVLFYDDRHIEESRHPHELAKHRRTSPRVRLDWAHHGLGTAAIGPDVLPEHALDTKPFDFDVVLS